MRVTSGKSRVRESRLPGSVRAKPNGRATRPRSKTRSAAGQDYYYHRATKTRIKVKPNTAEFAAEVARLNKRGAAAVPPEADTFGALVAAYRASPEFQKLPDRTRSDDQNVLSRILKAHPTYGRISGGELPDVGGTCRVGHGS